MKSIFFFIFCAVIFASFGINDECGIISITASGDCLNFRLKGSGIAIVDYGDGSEKDTIVFQYPNDRGNWSEIKRTNLDKNQRTVTISGKNITDLDCDSKLLILQEGRSYPRCNQITKLDVSKNIALKSLVCSNNQLTDLDVSKNIALTSLFCFNNQLTDLDVSKNSALTHLSCDNNQITVLDVSKNTALALLSCGNNQLPELNVSRNTSLTILGCKNNSFAALDVSKNTALVHLICSNNQLTELNVSKNTVLEHLICFDNQLTTLDVAQNTSLKELRCNNNQLISLDVSRNMSLVVLYCNDNQFSSGALNLLFSMLHENIVTVVDEDKVDHIMTKIINKDNNPGSVDCDRSIAERKGWFIESF